MYFTCYTADYRTHATTHAVITHEHELDTWSSKRGQLPCDVSSKDTRYVSLTCEVGTYEVGVPVVGYNTYIPISPVISRSSKVPFLFGFVPTVGREYTYVV